MANRPPYLVERRRWTERDKNWFHTCGRRSVLKLPSAVGIISANPVKLHKQELFNFPSSIYPHIVWIKTTDTTFIYVIFRCGITSALIHRSAGYSCWFPSENSGEAAQPAWKGWTFNTAVKIVKLQWGKKKRTFPIWSWLCTGAFISTHCSCCYGDRDRSDGAKIVPWINSMPQGRQDKGQRHLVPGDSVITHPEEMRGIKCIQVCEMESWSNVFWHNEVIAALTFWARFLFEYSSCL